jgi:hypothetical protein
MTLQQIWPVYTNNISGSHSTYVGNFTPSFDSNNVMSEERSTATEHLSEEVEKILNDIDSGTVEMVNQTADEFIADMKNDLAKTEKED